MKKCIVILIALLVAMSVMACSSASKPVIDYGDAESFEAALNNGENLEGKIVSFTVTEFHPDSKLGYNAWAGEHLNFVSKGNPNIKDGDTVIAKATKIENLLGSWVITYEKVDAVVGDATITSSGPSKGNDINGAEETTAGTSGSSTLTVEKPQSQSNEEPVTQQSSEELPLELKDYGWYMDPPSSYSDEVYIHFCGIIHNPNEGLKAEFPEVIVTAKNGDGSILGTGSQMGMVIMPDDTITLVGMFSMPISDITEDAQIYFDLDWSELSSANRSPEARTSDFVVDNITERNGSENHITGEVTNNSAEEQDVNLSMVLRKDGQIVFMENTFVDGCKPGKPKAFEFQRYASWPDHDAIEITAQPW